MRTTLLILVSVVALAAGCTGRNAETRAREAEKKIKESIPDIEGKALAQKVSPDEVKRAQAALTVVDEYQGAVNGELDTVTVNAIEAFQRKHDITPNGMLNSDTRRALDDALAHTPKKE